MKPQLILDPAEFISISGSPKSLVIDEENQRTYATIEEGKTVVIVIDLKTRKQVAGWLNDCHFPLLRNGSV